MWTLDSRFWVFALLGVWIAGVVAATPARADEELWVLRMPSAEISVIGTVDDGVRATFYVGDPNNDLVQDDPTCLAFSTDGSGAPLAFIGQGQFLTVWDVNTRTQRRVIDLALATPFLTPTIETCAAAETRSLSTSTGSSELSALYVGFKDSTGILRSAVMDQAALAGTSTPPILDVDVLALNGEFLGVEPLNTVAGRDFLRAAYLLERPAAVGTRVVQTILAADDVSPPAWTVGPERFVTDGSSSGPIEIATPLDREFPVVGAGGRELINLDSGARCQMPRSVVDVEVAGPGPNSYSLFALELGGSSLWVVDPLDCSLQTIAVGQDPQTMAIDANCPWGDLYVGNFGDNTLTHVYADGSPPTTISLSTSGGLNSSGPGGPVMSGFTQTDDCVIKQLDMYIDDFDNDGQRDDIVINWTPVNCAGDAIFDIKCQCADLDDVDCPCAVVSCDCEVPSQDPSCICPGVANTPYIPQGGSPGSLLAPIWDEDPVDAKNPWKKLGDTGGSQYIHMDVAPLDGDWAYTVQKQKD